MLQLTNLALTDKSGRELLPILDDMSGRENALLICNFGCDDPSANLSAHLLEEHSACIAKGLAELAQIAGCRDVLLYAAALDVSALKTALQDAALNLSVSEGPASPVLREPTALYSVLDKGLIRTGIAEAEYRRNFLSQGYQDRPTLTIDAETAYTVGRIAEGLSATKHVAVITSDVEFQEFPLGTALSAALGEAADGLPILLGGVSGSFLSAEDIASTKLCNIWEHDCVEILGHGTCVVARTAQLYAQIRDLSCAKCVMCREGSWQLSAIFSDMTSGKADREDIALIEEICPLLEKGAICEFGRKMVRAACSALAVHREEFLTHITSKLCADDQCVGLMKYVIDPTLCTGCGDCLDVCPEDAITGEPDFIHMIDERFCSKCGKCATDCSVGAVKHTGSRMKVPKRLTRVGRFR